MQVMSYFWKKQIPAQGMYWRILIWKRTSKAMLKLVCWFYFQVWAVLYCLPWFQVTFWEGAQTMPKPWENQEKKTHAHHAHLDDIHEMWLSRHGPWDSWTSIGLFFPLVFENSGQRLQKNRDNKNKVNEGPWVAGTCVVFFIFLGLSLEVEVWPASACVVCDQKNFVFF